MPKIQYIDKNFRPDSLALIQKVNRVVSDYHAQGYDLTLRQVYYQMVARDIIPNNQRSYKNLGSLINDARLAGLIDWNAIEDRTRNLRRNSHWADPGEIVSSAAYSYHLDHWEDQQNYVEVWGREGRPDRGRRPDMRTSGRKSLFLSRLCFPV